MITKRVQYRYDSVRNKIGMTDADGGLHTYTYDVMRRLTGVINPLGERTTYAYDLNGRRTSVQLANGTRTSYVYDVASRVQSVHTLKSDDSTVSKFEYAYDGNGRRTSVLEADGSRVTWTYDRISQVTSEWRTGTNPHRHTFTYDSVGNRTLKIEDGERTTLVYDACNQLLTSADAGGTTTFTYDGNGNQTVVQKPNGDRTTQIWDYEKRLVKTIQPSGGVTSIAYDADGLRLKLEEPTGTKLFVWDDQNYLAETDGAGATETAFTAEPSAYGSLISHRKAGETTTYHFDALGSTRALTDESEAVLERYNYTAFGTLLGSPTLFTPFLWGGMVGYYWDNALATQYIRARHYQPAIARWISLDPIGFAGGDANLFRYVRNSPCVRKDPSGLICQVGKQSCDSIRDKVLTQLKEMIDKMSTAKTPCPPPTITCCPEEKPTGRKALAFDDPCILCFTPGVSVNGFNDRGKLFICPGNIDDDGFMVAVLLEEIQHYYDRCDKKTYPEVGCEVAACVEMRGKTFAGECDEETRRMEGETREQCLVRRVVASLNTRKDCKGKDTKAIAEVALKNKDCNLVRQVIDLTEAPGQGGGTPK